MALLLQLDVSPLNAQVALIDATWQDYPQWETGEEEWVAYRAPSLVSPDRPPYPGFVVATRGDLGPDGPREVQVEVWSGDEPTGLRCVHENILWVANHGIFVGNDEGHMAKLMLAGVNTLSGSWSTLTGQTTFPGSSLRLASTAPSGLETPDLRHLLFSAVFKH